MWGRSKAEVGSDIGQGTPNKGLQGGFAVEIGAFNPNGIGKLSQGPDFIGHISNGGRVGSTAYYRAHVVLLTGEQVGR